MVGPKPVDQSKRSANRLRKLSDHFEAEEPEPEPALELEPCDELDDPDDDPDELVEEPDELDESDDELEPEPEPELESEDPPDGVVEVDVPRLSVL